MIQQTPVVVWLLLSSRLSVCLFSAIPLSTIHNISMRGRQGEQIINGEEKVDESRRQQDQDTGNEVDVFPISALYHRMGRYRDGRDGTDLFKKGQSLLRPQQQSPTTTVRGKNVDKVKNTNIISASSVPVTNTTAPSIVAAEDTNTTVTISTIASSAGITTTVNTSFATTSMPYPAASSVHPPCSSSSSCSSSSCKWLASRHFIAVISMTVTWLVALIILYWMTRTAKGRLLLDTWSSSCTSDKKDQEENQVLAKGIGYFDGSPGLRRFVLIEDEDEDDDDEEEEEREEEEEDNGDDLFASECWCAGNKEDMGKGTEEREGENRMSTTWKPPRKGTYILHEASKKDVLEVGTYRLQENGEEVGGKEEVEYILEGATYILQSERVERGEAGRKVYGQMGSTEGLYGVVGRKGLRGVGHGRVDGLERVYGIMGKGLTEQDRYRRRELGLYGILQEEGTGGGRYRKAEGVGGRKREKEDGVLLLVRDLEEALGGEEREEEVRKEDRGEGGKGESERWRDLKGIAGDKGIEDGEKGARREVEERVVGVRRGRKGKGVDDSEEEGGGERGNREAEDTLGRKEGKGARIKLGRGWENLWETSSPPPPKRAASFPMEHFLSSHLSPRKLSLILEEDIY